MLGLLFSILISTVFSTSNVCPVIKVGEGGTLSKDSVYYITQDENGNMWFSTDEGVFRYDGYEFHLFDAGIPSAKLFSDSGGRVWAIRGRGMYVLNNEKHSFCEVPGVNNHYLWDFEQVSDNLLLLATDEGVKAISPKLHSITEVPSFLKEVSVVKFFKDEEIVHVCTRQGEIRSYQLLTGELLSSFSLGWRGVINDMIVVGGRFVIVATDGYGIFILDNRTGEVTRLLNNTGHSIPGGDAYVRVLSVDEYGYVLAGTDNGLHIISIQSESGKTSIESQKDTHIESSIKSFCLDSEGGLWIGTYSDGVYYRGKASHFRNVPLAREGANNIRCLAEDDDGTLWAGANREGLIHFKRSGDIVESIDFGSSGVIDDEITSMVFCQDGKKILVGTSLGGLKFYDKSRHMFQSLNLPEVGRSVYALCVEDDNHIWAASSGGLFLIDIGGDSVSIVASLLNDANESKSVYHIIKTSNGKLWIGLRDSILLADVGLSEEGMYVMEPSVCIEKVTCVNDMLEFGSKVWVSTNNGLYSFTLEGEKAGMFRGIFSTEFLYSIQSDSLGRIWISSKNGLNCFDPGTGLNREFYAEDGMEASFFNNSARYMSSAGKVYFGNQSGILYFDPCEEWKNRPSHIPEVSSVSINGIPLESPLDRRFVLKHFQNTISLNFSAPTYSPWGHDKFYYRFKSDGETWQFSKERGVTFSNLRPGKYDIELKCVNSDGIESPAKVAFSFIIRYPWYACPVSIAIYILVFLAIVWYFINKSIIKMKRSHQEDLAEAARLGMEELNRMKVEKYAVSPLSPNDFNFLFKVIQAIGVNISNEKFSVKELASIMCTSRSNLHLKIRRLTGISVIKLIRTIRMSKASDLLKTTDMPISEISAAVGFSSPSYFAACFKEETGMTPGSFR